MEINLLNNLKRYGNSDYYPFHMPGHKRRTDAEFSKNFPNPYSIDITEIDGFDNLHHPDGILKKSMDWAAKLYGADKTYYLINGGSCGILSAISATVSHGGTILMGRNCHKSAYHGAVLQRLRALYLYPDVISGFGLAGGISPHSVERMLTEHREIEAVLIVSPTYEGVVSDIGEIAGIVHAHGLPLVVDEAHGAHFSFGKAGDFPPSALLLGADAVIQSLHKTLPSLTQTAVMHVRAGMVDLDRFDRFASMFQSSSPSYVLLAGIEECLRYMEGRGQKELEAFGSRLKKLRECLREMDVLRLFDGIEGGKSVWRLDASRIVISTRNSTISGPELLDLLRKEFHLELELCGPDYVTAITVLSDTQEGLDRLRDALLEVDKRLCGCGKRGEIVDNQQNTMDFCGLPESVMTMGQALDAPGKAVALDSCQGLVSQEFIYVYPPGIPMVVPGEVLKPELLEAIRQYKSQGLSVQGTADRKLQSVLTVDWHNN